MRSGDLIIKTLKRIGYQEADSLSDSDFIALTSKELKSFLEVFCTLDENNVLTTEEIEAYSAITPAELAKIEILKKNSQFEKNDTDEEKRKEANFLQEQLVFIENHNKTLERQTDLFKKHEESLLQENESFQKFLLNARKGFKAFEITKVPKAEEEFVSSFRSCLEIAEDIESLLLKPDTNESKLPTTDFVEDLIQKYIEDEEKVLQCITSYMQTNFQVQEDGSLFFINSERLRHKEFEKEASFLKKNLKKSMIDNVMSDMKACETKSIVKHFETVIVSDIHCPSSQLRHKLDSAIKLNEQLKKKEESYETYVCDAISKHVDALVAELVFSTSQEMINNIQLHIEKISVPKNYLIQQRLRTEVLIASLNEHMDNYRNLKVVIQNILKLMNKEQLCLDERQVQIEKELSAEIQDDQHPDEIVLSSLHRILASSEDFKVQDMSKFSITDVVQKANNFLEIEENFKRIHEENLKTIDLLENQVQCLESLLYADKKYSDWPDLKQSLNADLNHLVMKLNSFEGRISECNQDIDQKQKLLLKRKNLQLGRQLYVYALMNRELFEKYIDEIKLTIENSTN